MKISHFLAKICHFDGHFEFLNFSGMKRHRRSNILTDSCSMPNYAMEKNCFIPDLKKRSSDMPNPTIRNTSYFCRQCVVILRRMHKQSQNWSGVQYSFNCCIMIKAINICLVCYKLLFRIKFSVPTMSSIDYCNFNT